MSHKGAVLTLTIPMRAEIPYDDRVLAGILLIRKYHPTADMAAEHEAIWFGSIESRDLMTPEEQALMDAWGWHENEDSWHHFV